MNYGTSKTSNLKHGEKINDNINPPMKIYENKIENRITFKIKTRYLSQTLNS